MYDNKSADKATPLTYRDDVSEEASENKLTPTELMIVQLKAAGLSHAEIGRLFYRSEAYVTGHLNSVFHKLKMWDIALVIVHLTQQGFLSLPYLIVPRARKSQGEARVAAFLAQNHSTEQIARRLGLSCESIRSAFINRLTKKYGVKTKRELVVLLLQEKMVMDLLHANTPLPEIACHLSVDIEELEAYLQQMCALYGVKTHAELAAEFHKTE